jgi:3-hydroxyacyl-CoA dehydrogenase
MNVGAPPELVHVSVDAGVAVIEIANPPVNVTSHGVRHGLISAIKNISSDPTVSAAVIVAAGRTFVAGADIREQGKPPQAPILPEVCNAIEACPKPIVAAIHGTALGGGFEIALAAHARIATPDARVGLPEVTLGIIPGAGGTQRPPRLAGVMNAIELVTSGKPISAPKALASGLIDRIAARDLRTEALTFARELIGKPPRRTGALQVPAFDRKAVETAIAAIEKRARGQVAPARAARTVVLSAELDIASGLTREREVFGELVNSDQAAALRHVFFAEREVVKVPGLDNAVPLAVKTIGIVGAGTMGSAIAVTCADAGYSVIVCEQDEGAALSGRERIEAIYARSVQSKRITESERAERVARIEVRPQLSKLAVADLVIEAVFDDLSVKQDLFRALEPIVRSEAILATNTSYLDPDRIADATERPERVVGMHFFAPANVMRLLEVVRLARTAPDVLSTTLAVGKKLRKLPVVSGVCEGFIGNRIWSTYRKQAEYMLEDGALPHEVDAAMEALGFPMGPFAVSDLSGLEIAWARRTRLAATRDPRERYVTVADTLCDARRFGQKSGAGWYRYVDGKRQVDPEVTALVEAASRAKGITRRPVSSDEIQARTRAAMVNEGAKILSEGIAMRSLDIDLVLINGYGYPSWRGGPMFEADRLGLDNMLAEVRRTAERDGFGWEPAPLLVDLAQKGMTFASLTARP